ncbi:ATP-dependent RecD-like DNA helicase [Corynebacterium sp. NML 120412]|uniref:ATP-dependent DNA helicase n=1 Tax=Corynebacterium sp. NML 120412 TaxID=2029401 RepID=UPI001303F825|nr:ATP-dependent RecD-like DNA helicase [Corynebacterium sp. NML 120412]
MPTVLQQIQISSRQIAHSISGAKKDRALESQFIANTLRNLVEAVILGLDGLLDEEMSYEKIKDSKKSISGSAKNRCLLRFHDYLQISVSHYSPDGDNAERLMLKYLDNLKEVRELVASDLGLSILENLEDFPVDRDPALAEYYALIAATLSEESDAWKGTSMEPERYYIDSIRPWFVGPKTYYQVEFRDATDYSDKVDRMIAFTDRRIDTNYSTKLWLKQTEIQIMNQSLPITLILDHEVSIRPAELSNLIWVTGSSARPDVRSGTAEYRNLSKLLTHERLNLLELVLAGKSDFENYLNAIRSGQRDGEISRLLTDCRKIIVEKQQGENVLRYLLFTANNRIIKCQLKGQKSLRGPLAVSSACYPFETMPFASSLVKHNPKLATLLACIPSEGREGELLYRRVRDQIERTGEIYVPIANLSDEEMPSDNTELLERVRSFNSSVKSVKALKQQELIVDKRNITISNYEQTLGQIFKELRELTHGGDEYYEQRVCGWLEDTYCIGSRETLDAGFDDEKKVDYLKRLFSKSRATFLYGPAGTGKSTMINMVAMLFSEHEKLFLAHTQPAVDNMRRRVKDKRNSSFSTIASYLNRDSRQRYTLLVIDECSTVDNREMLKILERRQFDYILLVGDNYQLESVRFGNWFDLIKMLGQEREQTGDAFNVFELDMGFRTTNDYLKKLWASVRKLDGEIEERLSKSNFVRYLDETFFSAIGTRGDEITLCLNYDGLYGVNNINRFLQQSNPGRAAVWNSRVYKVNDPVLFRDSSRLRGLVYNNLKGKIVKIEEDPERHGITFDVELDRPEEDIRGMVGQGGHHVAGSTIRIYVNLLRSDDQDLEEDGRVVPFQVAYASSIHKAQGLEFDRVRVVITSDSEEHISHSVFYTAITRARKDLTIYWSPESQARIVTGLDRPGKRRNLKLLQARNII